MNDQFRPAEEAADSVVHNTEKEAALNKLEGAKSHASHIADEVKGAARDLGDAAKLGASAFRGAAVSKARTTKYDAQGKAISTRDDFEANVRREPMKYVGISFGVGFVVGWLFRG